jgi:hypothetical protein
VGEGEGEKGRKREERERERERVIIRNSTVGALRQIVISS